MADGTELIRLVAPEPDPFLDEATKEEIVRRVYTGKTLYAVCGELMVPRETVDLTLRQDSEFNEALTMAEAALGDQMAERALEALQALGRLIVTPENPAVASIPLEERVFAMRAAKLIADYSFKMAERISNRYRPKSPEKGLRKKPKRFASTIPPRDK